MTQKFQNYETIIWELYRPYYIIMIRKYQNYETIVS